MKAAGEVVIRPARKADAEALGALWLAFMQEQAAQDARAAPAEDARTRWANDFPVWLQDERVRLFVAEQQGHVVGFATAHRWAPPPIYADGEEVYLDELYVKPEARRQGVGARLVEAVRDWAETLAASGLRLAVLVSNDAGRAFWEQQQARAFSVTLRIALREASSTPVPSRKRIGF